WGGGGEGGGGAGGRPGGAPGRAGRPPGGHARGPAPTAGRAGPAGVAPGVSEPATAPAPAAAPPVPAPAQAAKPATPAASVPALEHVIVVVMENKDFGQAMNRKSCPFTSQLAASGGYFTESHAVMHPSQPNDVALR